MSKLLEDISQNKITVEECLSKLLIIANKTSNKELASWVTNELNGYDKFNKLPEYRKCKSRNIIYSGINGRMQVQNVPIGSGYLTEKTLKSIENVGIFSSILEIEANKDSENNLHRDLTQLASEIYKNTNDGYIGVSCTSVTQILPILVYKNIYSNVKTRIINLLCSYESAGINIDKLCGSRKDIVFVKEHNKDIYVSVVVDGQTMSFEKRKDKIMWNIIIPIITAVVSGIIVFIITKLFS